MPIYEYKCRNSHTTERRLPAESNVRQIDCPKCDEKAENVYSRTARPQFKGSGFFETDYKR